jgi:polyisoprenoid-binding protein YceI
MRKLVAVAILSGAVTVQCACAQEWNLSGEESFIIFIAKNLGMKVSGKMAGMQVVGSYNAENIFASRFVGSVDVSTIDTQISMRDNHLKSSDYFDVAKYPTITFNSRSIAEAGSALKVVGELTIKGVSKTVEITFTIQKEENKHTLIGNVTIQRKDFDLGSNTTLMMADTIQVRIVAVFVRPPN